MTKKSQSIVVTSGKGGVGKTTTVANLGVELSRQGLDVVVIDLDFGLRNLDIVLGLDDRIAFDLFDVLSGVCPVEKALIRDKRYERLAFLAAAQGKQAEDIPVDELHRLVEELKDDFDYILIDCPAGIGKGFSAAVAAGDVAIVVVTPEASSVRDADKILALLEQAELADFKLLINRLRPKMVSRNEAMSPQEIVELLGVGVIGVLVEDEHVIAASNRGEVVVLDGKSPAAQGYQNIAKRLLGERVPIMQITHKPTFTEKFKNLFAK